MSGPADPSGKRVAVIGAGFSGVMTATHLARGGVRATLIERSGRFGRGVAYGGSEPTCLLNVPAGRMCAFPDDPDHFVRWASARDPRLGGGTFPPRALYGEYLESILREAERETGDRLTRVMGEAVTIETPVGGAPPTVVLADGRRIQADAVVLAVGNFPPAALAGAEAIAESGRYVADPWASPLVGTDEDVLLVGTGLTMMDVALTLAARGQRGRIWAVSRRGLMPQPHRESDRPPRSLLFPDSMRPLLERATPVELLRALREEVRAGAERGDDWREVVTSLRSETQRLWRAMDERGRRQFLRHLLPFWDTHRHRAAPATSAGVAALIDRGDLRVLAGRIESMLGAPDGARVVIRLRGGQRRATITVGRVINCTGPETDFRRVRDPLVRSLLDRGVITPDPLGLGVRTADDGAAIDAGGASSPWLFVVGPMRKGDLWETTAAPELRVQALEVARRVAGQALAGA